MQYCVTITRVSMVCSFQTRSRHWNRDGCHYTEVAKEGCNAPGWRTEQGKALALGSGRISCQNPDVVQYGYKPYFETLAKNTFYHAKKFLCIHTFSHPTYLSPTTILFHNHQHTYTARNNARQHSAATRHPGDSIRTQRISLVTQCCGQAT